MKRILCGMFATILFTPILANADNHMPCLLISGTDIVEHVISNDIIIDAYDVKDNGDKTCNATLVTASGIKILHFDHVLINGRHYIKTLSVAPVRTLINSVN